MSEEKKWDLNLIPLKEQVNVIWLSKVFIDPDELQTKTTISSIFICYILRHQTEILRRWLKASRRSKADSLESYKYRCIDLILGEWIRRKIKRAKRTIRPLEIEEQANIIKEQLGVASYGVGMYVWNMEFMDREFNNSSSLDIAKIIDDISYVIRSNTYIEFKEKIKEFHLKPLHHEDTIKTKGQNKRFKGKQITETTDGNVVNGLINEDINEDDTEECGDQKNEDLSINISQIEALASISSDTKEVERTKSFDKSQNENRAVIFSIENEESCKKTSKDESETMEVSLEKDENSHYDLLIDLKEEPILDSTHQTLSKMNEHVIIKKEEDLRRETIQCSSHQPLSNMSINAANLNEEARINIEEQDENSFDDLFMDLREEIKQELQKNLDDNLFMNLQEENTQGSCHQSSANMSIKADNLIEHAIIKQEEELQKKLDDNLLMDLQEEITQGSYHQSSANMSINADNLNEHAIIKQGEEGGNIHDNLFIDLQEENTQGSCHQSSANMSIKTDNLNEHAIIKQEDENSHDNLFMDFREETTLGSRPQSSTNMSINAANFNEERIREIEEQSENSYDNLFMDLRKEIKQESSCQPPPQQGKQPLVFQATDSIEELVKKYQRYKRKPEHSSLLANNIEYHQHYDNDVLGQTDVADEVENILNNKEKSYKNLLPNNNQYNLPMPKKICIEGFSKNIADDSKDHTNDSKNKYKQMDIQNLRENELMQIDDESNSSSPEPEYQLLEIVSDEEDSNDSTKPLTLHTPTNLTPAAQTSDIVLRNNIEAFSYLKKLKDFCLMKQDQEAFKIVSNLQMIFLMAAHENKTQKFN